MRNLNKNNQLISSLILILLNICIFSSFTEETKNEFQNLKFHEFPDSLNNFDKQFLISNFKPNKHYKYWQCKYLHNCAFLVDENGKQVQKGELIYLRGDSSKYKKLADEYCTYNMFPKGDHDPVSGFYIVAVNDSDKVDLIDNDNIELFIGDISNLEEAAFVVYLHHFYAHSYTETDSTYIFNAGYVDGTAILKLNKKGGLRIVKWKGNIYDESQPRDIY